MTKQKFRTFRSSKTFEDETLLKTAVHIANLEYPTPTQMNTFVDILRTNSFVRTSLRWHI